MDFYLTIHFLVILSTIFEFSTKKTKIKILWFWVLFFTYIGGFRWKIGGDWDQYYYYFENCSLLHIFDTVRYGNDFLEPGFVFLNAICKIILGKFYIYNILVTFFYQFTIISICRRYSPQYPILMYAFIMTTSGTASYFAVRAGLAAAMMYWTYLYIEKRELKKFLLIILIGSNIHILCLVMLPFYWVGKIRFNYLTATVCYFAVALFAVLFREYFQVIALLMGGNVAYKADVYTSGETIGFSGATSFGWILYYMLFMLFVFMRKYSNNKYFYNTLLVLYFALRAIMMVFSDGMGDLTRLSSGLGPVFSILLIFAFTKLMEKKKMGYILIAFTLYISVSFYNYSKIGTGFFFMDTCVPYKTIFDYNNLGTPNW
ncbi:MAG: EpsG family protein [Prevotella sp.]|nr:EpsG family protein [Prevotella sp.]